LWRVARTSSLGGASATADGCNVGCSGDDFNDNDWLEALKARVPWKVRSVT